MRHLLALCGTRDERDQRDAQHAFQAVLLNPEESLHSFSKRINHVAHALKLSGVELTETEVVDQYLFSFNSLHQSSSNTSGVMRYFKHQDKRSLERVVDKEAPTELVLTELQWDLQNEEEHTRRFAPPPAHKDEQCNHQQIRQPAVLQDFSAIFSARPPLHPARGVRTSGTSVSLKRKNCFQLETKYVRSESIYSV